MGGGLDGRRGWVAAGAAPPRAPECSQPSLTHPTHPDPVLQISAFFPGHHAKAMAQNAQMRQLEDEVQGLLAGEARGAAGRDIAGQPAAHAHACPAPAGSLIKMQMPPCRSGLFQAGTAADKAGAGNADTSADIEAYAGATLAEKLATAAAQHKCVRGCGRCGRADWCRLVPARLLPSHRLAHAFPASLHAAGWWWWVARHALSALISIRVLGELRGSVSCHLCIVLVCSLVYALCLPLLHR